MIVIDSTSSWFTVHDITKEVWQESQFIKTYAISSQYLRNDSLIFEVSKEQ